MPIGRILLKSISESKKLAALKTDGARLLYTWLIPHVDVNGCFSGDVEVIKGQVFTRLKKTDKEIETYLEDLRLAGLIVRYGTNGDTFIFLPSFEEKQPTINREREAKPRIPLPTPDQLQTNSGSGQAEITLKLNRSKVKVKYNAGLRSAVVAYLNEKTGKRFSENSAPSILHINARIEDGRTLDEFKRVIDVKTSQWKGNPEMDKFLRPETLFGTKMDGYLNESIIPDKKTDVEKGRRVGLKGWEDQLTDDARARLPKIDAEFDAKYPNLDGPDRNEYRAMRLDEIHKGERP